MNEYESDEELYFSWYLDELGEYGFIQGYEYHPYTFRLSDAIHTKCISNRLLKTKVKIEDYTLLRENTYTPDFGIIWNSISSRIFTGSEITTMDKKIPFVVTNKSSLVFNTRKAVSFTDVKSIVPRKFAKNATSIISFPIEQKWVYSKYGIYVQKVVIGNKSTSLFAETFTPKRYLKTNKKLIDRNISHKIVSIEEFVEQRKKFWDEIERRQNQKSLF